MMTVGDVDCYHPCVAPGRVGNIPMNNGMMKAVTAMRRPGGDFAGSLIHAVQPESSGFARLRRIADVDGDEDIIGKAVEQRGGIRPFAASVPDAVNSTALDRHESNLARRVRY